MFDFFAAESYKSYSMKLPSTIIALFASLLIIGCATKQEQPTPAQTQSSDPTKKWEKKENQY
jgi:outer membrane biogenesis lipoprotein LolB